MDLDLDLFSHRVQQQRVGQPLPERMRPRSLDEVVGQQQLIGPGCLLRPGKACRGRGACAAHGAWTGVKTAYEEFLDRTTVADVRHDR